MKGRRPFASALLLLLAVSACEETPASPPVDTSTGDFLAFATQIEVPLEKAIGEFDAASARRDAVACSAAARRGLEAARAARDELEKHPVPEKLLDARREELMFLNHVVPGFQAFLAGDAGSAEVSKVREILIRGRSHQSRARAWLQEAGTPR